MIKITLTLEIEPSESMRNWAEKDIIDWGHAFLDNEPVIDIFDRHIEVEREPMNSELSQILNYELQDDNTSTGGVSFQGETVKDFLEEIDEVVSSIAELNRYLIDCGIKPIEKEQ